MESGRSVGVKSDRTVCRNANLGGLERPGVAVSAPTIDNRVAVSALLTAAAHRRDEVVGMQRRIKA